MSRVLLVAGGEPSDWPTIEPATYDYFVGIDRGCLHLLEADLPLQLAVGDSRSFTTISTSRDDDYRCDRGQN